MSTRHTAWLAGAVTVVAAATLYLVTLDNGLRPGELAGGDLITHHYAQVQGRPSNAPGYPLYTIGGWLWFHGLRLVLGSAGNPIAVLSAYSTLWALTALALLYAVAWRVTGRWPLSLAVTAFYAVTYFFWYYAVSSEQYASAVAQTLAIVLVAFIWDDAVGPRRLPPPNRRADRWLLLLAFLCGLSLAHLVTVAFIVPPLLWFVLSRQPDVLRRPRFLAQAAGLALLPLLAYAFVFVRGAQHPEWRGAGQWPDAWSWFWDFVSTQQGRNELTWSLTPLWTNDFPELIWHELTWIVVLGGVAGLAALGRRRGGLLGGTLLIYLAFSFIDRLGNWYQVIMPAYALMIVSFSAAVDWLWRRWGTGPRRWVLLAALTALVLARGLQSWPAADQRNRPDDTALLAGQAILADDPPPHAAVLGVYTDTLSLRYLIDIWGLRPDLSTVDSAAARRVLDAGQRPLVVTEAAVPLLWQEVDPEARLSSAGATLVTASRTPATTLPPDLHPVNRPVGDGLALAGYAVAPSQTGWRVRLAWRADAPIGHDWSVSVRPTRNGELLTGSDGAIVQTDAVHPVHGFYPTRRWSPGEVVLDDYTVGLADTGGADGLQVVVYRVGDGQFENLGVLNLPLAP